MDGFWILGGAYFLANNYLDDLLGKISAYDLFNVLIPGALVTYSVSQMPLGCYIDSSDWLALFVMSYVLGLIASRIGSLCIEPLVRNLKPIRKRDYSAFAYAQERDPKVEHLLMISNMYRSMAGAGVLLVIILLALLLPEAHRLVAGLCAFIALFIASWIKQERYVEKRINFNLEERDKHERD